MNYFIYIIFIFIFTFILLFLIGLIQNIILQINIKKFDYFIPYKKLDFNDLLNAILIIQNNKLNIKKIEIQFIEKKVNPLFKINNNLLIGKYKILNSEIFNFSENNHNSEIKLKFEFKIPNNFSKENFYTYNMFLINTNIEFENGKKFQKWAYLYLKNR